MGRTTWLLGWDDDNGDDTDCRERERGDGFWIGKWTERVQITEGACVSLLFFSGVSCWSLCWFFPTFVSKVGACFGVELVLSRVLRIGYNTVHGSLNIILKPNVLKFELSQPLLHSFTKKISISHFFNHFFSTMPNLLSVPSHEATCSEDNIFAPTLLPKSHTITA